MYGSSRNEKSPESIGWRLRDGRCIEIAGVPAIRSAAGACHNGHGIRRNAVIIRQCGRRHGPVFPGELRRYAIGSTGRRVHGSGPVGRSCRHESPAAWRPPAPPPPMIVNSPGAAHSSHGTVPPPEDGAAAPVASVRWPELGASSRCAAPPARGTRDPGDLRPGLPGNEISSKRVVVTYARDGRSQQARYATDGDETARLFDSTLATIPGSGGCADPAQVMAALQQLDTCAQNVLGWAAGRRG